jgi:lipopolysaccharide biosynthesis glycosyltransferase
VEINIVMATDFGYVVPTAVAMHSVVKNCKGASVFFVIFVTGDVLKSSAKALLESFRADKIDVCLVAVDTIEQRSDLRARFEIAKAVIAAGNKLIAIKMLFPQILATKALPEFSTHEKLRNMKHFLWLDSDLIVVKELSQWYQSLLKTSRTLKQPIISANLMFIEMQPEMPYQEEMLRTYKFWGNDRRINSKNFVTSGGVLFWNLEIVPKLRTVANARTQPPVSTSLWQAVDTLLNLKHKFYEGSLFSTEEQVFGELLPDQAYFFPTTFNCRSAYFKCVDSGILNMPETTSEEDRQILQAINSGKVSIWHWDYEKKPWTYNPTEELRPPEKTWWDCFNEFFNAEKSGNYVGVLAHFFASVGNITMVQKYVTLWKIFETWPFVTAILD